MQGTTLFQSISLQRATYFRHWKLHNSIFGYECYKVNKNICITYATNDKDVTKSGRTARERRMVKLNEIKKQRELKKKMYPEWAKHLEKASQQDEELREIIGDSYGNPELMMKRVKARIRKKETGPNRQTGSLLAVNVVFKDINPTGCYVWIELHDSPSDKDLNLIGRTIRSWYVLGRLGGFNSANLQLTEVGFLHKPSYSVAQAMEVLPSTLHEISDLEFQENLGRFWVDMGTSDALALDILSSALVSLSSSHIGIKHLVFGGDRFGDWEQGMRSAEFGYKIFKI